ncbi:MAG TPA: hypothetical protein VNZ48_02565 [Xanthobacteraceae bacterium]|nr:hypothetical protein [Xanthobacteraceae bacterium]
MADSPSFVTRTTSTVAATLILLSPALWNRLPLLEYDTGGYLARWFEGYLVPSRSTTYGLFLAAGWPLDFWPIVILQALATVWIIILLLRIHRFTVHPIALPAITAVLALITALPWLASVLLTDIFAGLAVLALHTLVWHWDSVSRRERYALVLFIAFAGSTHSATFAVLLGLGAAALLLSWLSAKLVPRAGLAPMTVALALSAAMLLGANYVVSKTIAWTPGGYGLAFGRMLQDGIVTRYLNDHCPKERLKLCPYRNELPLDADTFLWGKSVFDKLGRFAGLGDEMRTIVLGSLRDYPAMQAETALRATARQLVEVATGEGIVTTLWHTYGIIERYTPSVVPAMRAARQQHGEIGFAAINLIDLPVAWAAMALLPVLLLLGVYSAEFADLGRLAATLLLTLFGNAVVCGVISDPHNRYGARMVWIVVFAVAMAATRAYALVREQTMIPKKPVPDLIRDGSRFSEKIMVE